MASSQLASVLFSILAPELPESMFHSEVSVGAFLAFNGLLGASRLLFIVGDSNGDFHGGFQVACKRIGVLESLRTAAGMPAVILSYAGVGYVYVLIVLVVSLGTPISLFKAPQYYCAYCSPFIGYFEGLLARKS